MRNLKVELCGYCLDDFSISENKSRFLCKNCLSKISRVYGKIVWNVYLKTGGFKGYGTPMKQKFTSVARRKMGIRYSRLKQLLDDFNITDEQIANWLTPEEFECYRNSTDIKQITVELTPQLLLELSSRGS